MADVTVSEGFTYVDPNTTTVVDGFTYTDDSTVTVEDGFTYVTPEKKRPITFLIT